MLFMKDEHTIALWRFGSKSPTDVWAPLPGSVPNEAGTSIGNATVRGGKFTDGKFSPKAILLNGAYGEFASVNHDPTFYRLKEITVEALFRPLDFDLRRNCNGEDIVSKGKDSQGGNPGGFSLRAWRNDRGQIFRYTARRFKSVRFQFTVDAKGTPLSSPFKPDEWYAVAGSYDGEMLRLRVNGHLEAEAPARDLQILSTDPLFVNHHTWEGGRSSNRMELILEEVRISDVARG